MEYLIKKLEPIAESPVCLADSKLDLRVQHTHEDELLRSYIQAATDYCSYPDGVTGRVLSPQSFELRVAAPSGAVALPAVPALEIEEITYLDTDGDEQEIDVENFRLYGNEDKAYIEPISGFSWPAMYRGDRFPLTIVYTAGYENVPENIKRAIRLIVAHWYENRTEVVVGTSVIQIPMGADALLNVSRKGWVG